MIHGKQATIAFLLLTSFLAATQTVQSQQYATTTLATILTTNQVSTVAAGTQVVTTTTNQTTLVFSGPKTIPGTHGVCGEYVFIPVNGTTGEVLSGSVMANSPVNVYLMTSTVYQAWEHQVVAGGTCTPSSVVGGQENITSYAFNMPIPASGIYDLVVHNLSESTVTAQVTANLTSAAPSMVTVVAYSTVTQQMIQTLMQTSVQTLAQTTTQTSSGGPDMTTIGVVVIVIIIIVAAAYLATARRRKAGKK